MATYYFNTGTSPLPDVGQLSYNGCVFSPLFETNVSGVAVKDEAGRTTKYMEYTITADGYVTLPTVGAFGATSTDATMTKLRQLLSAQGGVLIYEGRGNPIVVNQPGSQVYDVAWGPVPEVLDFQPLGAGLSAKIRWQVKVRIPEVQPAGGGLGPVLQFNEETTVTYDDAGYSLLAIRGTLEIPLTRITQSDRSIRTTVDAFRELYLDQVANSIDLTRFRVVKREFRVSRDKRTMEWSFAAEELPYMGLPANVTIARGTYSFKPAVSGMGLCSWNCTLRVTYTVRKDRPRRVAWDAFLALLRVRMAQSAAGLVPSLNNNNQNPPNPIVQNVVPALLGPILPGMNFARELLRQQSAAVANGRKAWLIDFSGEEGLYLDSRTVTFSASWRLITVFSHILIASGLWTKVRSDGGNVWATSVRNISGWKSWERNQLNPAQDAIVDFGGQ